MSVFASKIISQFLRIWLLSVFALGIFLSLGDISIDHGSLSYGVNNVYAAETGSWTTAPQKDTISTTISGLIDLGNLFIGVLTFLITPLIMLAGWLLSPDWTFGEIFGLRPILHQIWIFISNVVYVIFGFMLVGIAFANIFGAWGGEYEMKKMLPKLVTGILIVPFTWLIVSAILTISNILVASVISLPMETIMKAGGSTTTKMFDNKIIPKTIVYNKDFDYSKAYNPNAKNWENVITNEGTGWLKASGNFIASNCPEAGEKECLSIQEFLTQGGGGAYNLLSVYAYGIFQIQGFKKIELKQGINKIGDIASKLSFGFIFFVIFGILIIAIVYALLSRAIMLWMFAMFSPLFALSYVLGHGKWKLQEKVANFSLGHFISLAMVPVYVAAALAFGLMFLGLVMNATGQAKDAWAKDELISNSKDINIKTSDDGVSVFQFGQVSLTTIWVLNGWTSTSLNGALNMGKGIIGTIIMNILALVILWMAVMAALSADHITEHAIKPIADMGNSVGELAKHSPSYIPIPGLQGQSMKSITQWVQWVKWWVDQYISSKSGDITSKFGFAEAAKRNQSRTNLEAAIAKNDIEAMKSGFHELKNTYKDYNEMKRDGATLDTLKKMAQKTGGDVNSKDMTTLIASIEKWMEHKNPSSGWLFHDRWASAIEDWYLQSQIEKKSWATKSESSIKVGKPNEWSRVLDLGKSVFQIEINQDKSVKVDSNDITKLKESIGQFTKKEMEDALLRSGNMDEASIKSLIDQITKSDELKNEKFFKEEPKKSS